MENLNSVCFVSKIKSLQPIIGADKIELATVNGWTSTVQKNVHKEEDLVLCVTTDAVIPEKLAIRWGVINYLRKGNRVRTIKLKGVYSECILIPLMDLNGYVHIPAEGVDMMERTGISKYEPPAIQIQDSTGRKHKYHQNPNFHIYHKFPNQKNVPNMFDESDDVVITRKIHGTNARYGIVKKTKLSILDRIRKFFGVKWVDYEYIYGSHNVEKGSTSQGFYSTDVWREVAEREDIEARLWQHVKKLEWIGNGFILYGEIYGPGIQGEKYTYGENIRQIKFFDIELDDLYLPDEEFTHQLYTMGYTSVDVLYVGKWSKEKQDELNTNSFIEGTATPHEGIVVKHISGERSKISKVINPDYHIYAEKFVVPDSH